MAESASEFPIASARRCEADPFPSGPRMIKTRVGWVWLGQDGILRGDSDPDVELTVADVREIETATHSLVGDRPVLVLVDITNVRSMSRDARLAFGKTGRTAPTIALALLVRSRLSRVIGNFFLGLNRPKFPTQLFTDEAEAVAWLDRHRDSEVPAGRRGKQR